ncbi:hypothetical protein KFE25_008766 [Diacronema lutheri]|uniref:EF-hand domain-containing protein n=2 Tax=Diacronema lutheri TaxID=2081491 RepID=A0A8J6CHL5_DIALT|nr:hypothetical protein KFE25_008766 [Diacronema lutheri]
MAPRRLAALLCLAVGVGAALPSLKEAEAYIDKAADSVWSKDVGGKAIVGAGVGAVIGVLAKQLSDVINAVLMSLAGLVAFRVFTSFRPETFGAQSIQETFGELHARLATHLDQDGDGKLDDRDVRSVLARVMPFVRRQAPFVIGFALGLAVASSST